MGLRWSEAETIKAALSVESLGVFSVCCGLSPGGNGNPHSEADRAQGAI